MFENVGFLARKNNDGKENIKKLTKNSLIRSKKISSFNEILKLLYKKCALFTMFPLFL